MIRSILRHYRSADESQIAAGLDWYRNANEICVALADRCGLPLDNVACAMAHLSPRVRWAQNQRRLVQLLETGTTYGISSHVDNARQSLYNTTPFDTFSADALKTKSFARNITGDYQPVTVDMWAARAALGKVPESINRGMYRDLEAAYRRAAKRVGIAPAQFQAVVWCAIRGKSD